MLLESIVVMLALGLVTSVESVTYMHELYAAKSNPVTNRSVACGICESRGGTLARRPELNDWEIAFNNLSHLQNEYYWIDLVKTDTEEWYWGDGVLLNLSHLSSLPMTPTYNQTYTGWSCAIWNLAEPFLLPADCSVQANVVCAVPTTEPNCTLSKLEGKKMDAATPGLTQSTTTYEDCRLTCQNDGTCWAVDYDNSTGTCRTLNSASQPPVPSLVDDPNYDLFGRTCVKYNEMPEEESNFVCNCGAITLPETEEEIQKFVDDYKEEVKKELVVPKDTLSATVRKKVSAPDERKSSTGLGALGIAMMVIVFGGLVLMDLTTVFAHIKMAATNVKEVFTSEPDSSDA